MLAPHEYPSAVPRISLLYSNSSSFPARPPLSLEPRRVDPLTDPRPLRYFCSHESCQLTFSTKVPILTSRQASSPFLKPLCQIQILPSPLRSFITYKAIYQAAMPSPLLPPPYVPVSSDRNIHTANRLPIPLLLAIKHGIFILRHHLGLGWHFFAPPHDGLGSVACFC